ncbi:hypothetical protein TMatcc_005862 [Talaromyces marneffei ATCC 18224]|uniref:Uncharacterized protein n=1 Tax=Talaromyces marneffei (strain ATCC 18224 / CBS 334.59 / QM 7333) TaxID=441960 RepID=B6Q8T4_TALMQ|nr:conserved hypothetical protein [Talaromyces marneffei ATCC 18224]
MPRPPARRARTVRQAPEKGSIKAVGRKPNTTEDESQANIATPRRGRDERNNDTQVGADLTPTRDLNENVIASSPAENTTTTSIRPPTRARGYSSTLSLVGRKGDFNSRIGSTPGFESSILSNFKKRSRQPSLLQMMQADDEDSSDFDDDDFLGGFSPQDESTPLNVARVSNAAERQLAVSPSRPPLGVASPSSTESRKRKRQSATVNDEHVEQASPLSRSSSVSILTPAPESPIAGMSDELPSFTMATPMSSSTASPVRLMTVERQTATTTTDKNETAPPLPKVTTLSLQTRFLPQRRTRRRQQADDSDDEEDIDPANEDSDEDELAREVRKRPQRSRRKGLSTASSEKTNAKLGKPSRRGKKNLATGKAVDTQGNKSQRTYSRQAADKENNYLSDDSSVLSSPPPSEDLNDSELDLPSHASKKRVDNRELQAAALKFAEVDQWEMEFEDVSYTESSPMR